MNALKISIKVVVLWAVAALVALVVAMLTVGSASAETVVATPSDRQGWDLDSQTRTAGRYAFSPEGLHVWTLDASSQAKVAGYVEVTSTLSAVAAGSEPTIEWTGTTPPPGFQLVINAGGKSRILVGEPTYYGNKWWMSNSSCDSWCDDLDVAWAGGGGSAHSATLDQWATALDAAEGDPVNVTAVGFSLGSGVKGDGTITKITFGSLCFTFDEDAPPTTTTTSTSTSTTSTTTSTSTSTSTSSTPPTSSTSSSASSTTRFPVTTTTPVYYANCTAVIDAGKAPIESDVPGYRLALDADRDGLGCEREELVQRVSADRDLAATGASVGTIVAVGTLLLIGGATVVAVAVRRRRSDGSA